MKTPKTVNYFEQRLKSYRFNGKPLSGIPSEQEIGALVSQIIDSVARVDYVKTIATRDISPKRLDPKEREMFDPIRAAIQHARNGNLDEAYWLIFLFVHCGKHLRKGYALLRMVYGALNDKFIWSWDKFSKNPSDFSLWLNQHMHEIEARRKEFGFGNHRKYESISKLPEVLGSYAEWIGPQRSHQIFFEKAKSAVGNDPKLLFDYLYESMGAVHRFGRTAKFDYLTMVGKVGLQDIEAPSAYLADGTGPLSGARLLFSGAADNVALNKRELDRLAIDLGNHLGVGMQVIEDSLCNWQKSPSKYIPFRG